MFMSPSAVEQQPGLCIRTSATWSVESGQINGTGGHSPHERAVLGHTTRSLAL